MSFIKGFPGTAAQRKISLFQASIFTSQTEIYKLFLPHQIQYVEDFFPPITPKYMLWLPNYKSTACSVVGGKNQTIKRDR